MRLILTALLCICFATLGLSAQSSLVDTIRIMNGEQMSARIIHKDIHQLKADPAYKELINSFQSNLESIINELPDYLNYKITYVKDVNLIMEEIKGVSKFRVENGQITGAYNSNTAVLHSEDLKVELFFDKIEEIISTDFNIVFDKAIAELKNRKKVLRPLTSLVRNDYTYYYGSGILTKGDSQNEKRRSLGLVFTPSIGTYRDDPIYEYQLGLGLVSKDNKRLVYAFAKLAHQYNRESKKVGSTPLWGIAYKFSKYTAIQFAFPIRTQELYSTLDFQAGFTLYPFKGLAITTYHNSRPFGLARPGFMPAISIGYTILIQK